MSVRRCRQEVDSREFETWKRYYEIEPWGEEREDYRLALMRADQNILHGGKSISLEKLMPQFGKRQRRQQTGAEIMAVMRAMAGSYETGKGRGNGTG